MPATRPTPRKPGKPHPLGAFGTARQADEKYLFGTEAEIRNREATGYAIGGTPPENAVPVFEQIRPGPTGKDANTPEPRHFGGSDPLKYGNNRRYN